VNTETDAGGHSDLLLVYAHGSGTGLSFRTSGGGWPASALRLATSARTRAALVAACRSLAAPPVSFPINLPAALLLQRVSSVVGGLWPLPSESTAWIIADVIGRLAAGERLMPALSAARTRVPDGYLDRWGLATHGIM
jgi:hypothetical protein